MDESFELQVTPACCEIKAYKTRFYLFTSYTYVLCIPFVRPIYIKENYTNKWNETLIQNSQGNYVNHLWGSIFPTRYSFQFPEYKPRNFCMPIWPVMTPILKTRNLTSVYPLQHKVKLEDKKTKRT